MKLKLIKPLTIVTASLLVLSLAACGSKSDNDSSTSKDSTQKETAAKEKESEDSAANDSDQTDETKESINYMVLVNKTHELPDDWETNLETVHTTNSVGNDVEVEKKAYDAYLELKAALEKENVYVDLDSARRSVADQQRIMDEFTEEYGADYAAKTVAAPGYSEHHTGLALDLYLIIDGKDVDENEDMIQYPEIWEKIHAKLADYGFILRYLEEKEHITGYGYEPWHIRYIDNKDIAKEITDKGMTLEGYLGTASEDPVKIEYGSSEKFTEEDMKAAVVQIKCKFASYDGCKLQNIRYAGDEASNEEKLEWVNKLNKDSSKPYTEVMEFLTDFHSSPETGKTTLTPDQDYNDYQWWLAHTADGGWEVVSMGY